MSTRRFESTGFEPSGFAAALLDPALPPPPGIVASSGIAAEERFAIYRNNVVEGLVRALATRFPAVARVVGDDFFAAMARVYAAQSPPRSPIMAFYGEDFPQFLAGFAPCADLPYLADLARVEAARTRAYHAADAAPLAAADFVSPGSDLAALRMRPHPSLFLLASPYPVATIFAMNNGDLPLAEIEDWHGEDVCVVRPHMHVEVHPLPKGGEVFLSQWAQGVTLAEAAQAALAAEPDFDLVENLSGAIRFGLIAEIVSQSQSL
jgi:hypothetical protein